MTEGDCTLYDKSFLNQTKKRNTASWKYGERCDSLDDSLQAFAWKQIKSCTISSRNRLLKYLCEKMFSPLIFFSAYILELQIKILHYLRFFHQINDTITTGLRIQIIFICLKKVLLFNALYMFIMNLKLNIILRKNTTKIIYNEFIPF